MVTGPVSEFFVARFEPAHHLIRGKVHRPLTDLEFTVACEHMLAEAIEHHCRYWLLDNQADDSIRAPDLNDWIAEEYLPRARTALGRAPCIAFLAPGSFWQTLQQLGPLPLEGPSVDFQAGAFTQEAEALAWLQTHHPLPLPKLITAEWSAH